MKKHFIWFFKGMLLGSAARVLLLFDVPVDIVANILLAGLGIVVLEKCTKSGAGTTDSEKGEEK